MKRSWRNLSLFIALFACFIGGIILSEWVRIGVIADLKVIDSYHFGSEAMIGHGGRQYASASSYARTALIEGICSFALGIFTFIASIKSNSRNAVIGCALIVIWVLINQLGILGL